MLKDMLKQTSVWGRAMDDMRDLERIINKKPKDSGDSEEVSLTVRGPRSRALIPFVQELVGKDKSMWNVEQDDEE